MKNHIQYKSLLPTFLQFIFSIILLSSCVILKKTTVAQSEDNNDERNYYYALTQAKKLDIFGSYKNAEDLYIKIIKSNDSSSAAHFQLSKIYLLKSDYKGAIYHGRKAEKIDGSNVWYKLNLAYIYDLINQRDSVIAAYERIIKLENQYEFAATLVKLYYINRKYDQAAKLAKAIIDEYGYVDEMINILIDAYNIKKDYQNIIDLIEVYLKKNDNDAYTLDLAEAYSNSNHFLKADSIYNKLYTIDSTDIKLKLSLIEHRRKQNKIEDSYKIISSVFIDTTVDVEIKVRIMYSFLYNDSALQNEQPQLNGITDLLDQYYKNDLTVKAVIADYYLKIDSLQDAADNISFLIRKSPNNYFLYEQILYLMMQMNQYDSVCKYVDLALIYFPDKYELYLYKGIASSELNKYETSIKALKDGISLIKSNEKALNNFYTFLAEAYYKNNNYLQSDTAFEMALLYDDSDLYVKNNYSYYLSLRETNLKRAKQLSKDCIKAEPNSFVYLDTYGWILFKMNKEKKALKYINKSLQLGGYSHADIIDHAGDIYYQLNNCTEAVNYWYKAIDTDSTMFNDIKNKIDSIDNEKCRK